MKTIIIIFLVTLNCVMAFSQNVKLPISFDPFINCVPQGMKYGYTVPFGKIYGFPQMRIFGWSDNGEILFSIERGIEGRGGTIISYFVQDLITDKTIWELNDDSFKWDASKIDKTKNVYENSIIMNLSSLKDEIKDKEIVLSDVNYNTMPIIGNQINITCIPIIQENGKDEFGFRKISYQILAKKNNLQSKIIDQENDISADNVYICGYFINSSGTISAIIVALEKHVFEGNELFYKIVGCNMNIGFK